MMVYYVVCVHAYFERLHFSVDCQQKAGPSAWTPFHESASAVTQLYKGNALLFPVFLFNLYF